MDSIVIFHCLVYLAFWLTNLLFQKTVNAFLSKTTGQSLNFVGVFLVFTTLVGLWSGIHYGLKQKGILAGQGWISRFVGIFYLLFFYASFIILFIMNPVQPVRLGQFLQYFRLVIDCACLLLIALGMRKWLSGALNARAKRLAPGLLIIIWMAPLFWPPGSVYYEPLPARPQLIAHRGASLLAPENTLTSMQKAIDLGAAGLETDIMVSLDGILFLMHDPTLARTTNVADLFPDKANDPASSFTWDELAHLDAGQWYQGGADYQGEPIPLLTDVLKLVRANHRYFIYDLRIPLVGHPFAEEAFTQCLEEIRDAGLPSRTWVLTSQEEIQSVRAVLPEAIISAGVAYKDPPSPQALIDEGYQLVNSEYGLSGSLIHGYNQAGLWVNLWTVDEPWQYSRVWLAGADSVTSNNIEGINIPRPVMGMSFAIYMMIWTGMGIFAVILAISRRNQNTGEG